MIGRRSRWRAPIDVQIVVSCLVPLAVGLLGAAAYGRRTGLLAVVFASLYFPFIEYGALFLSEIHFIFWLALAFAGFFARARASGGAARARASRRRRVRAVDRRLVEVGRAAGRVPVLRRRRRRAAAGRAAATAAALALVARLEPWLLRGAVVAVAAAPLLGVLARVCTRANDGRFCVTGNKVASDFLLGHYGRVADIEWRPRGPRPVPVRQPGRAAAPLRRPREGAVLDDRRRRQPAPRRGAGSREHPGEAIVLSLDHVYDTFFGAGDVADVRTAASWPLRAPVAVRVHRLPVRADGARVRARLVRRGARAAADQPDRAGARADRRRSPITVAIATGEVRYRIPFDIFFIIIACAYARARRPRGERGPAPRAATGSNATAG